MVAAVILAAGSSRRMGQPKQMLPLAGRPLIWHVARAVYLSKAKTTLVVTGQQHHVVENVVAEFSLPCVYNHTWQTGMAGSLKAGLKALNNGHTGVLFMLADQPFITSEIIDLLIISFLRAQRKTIVVPEFHGKRGNPAIFDLKTWYSRLMDLQGDEGARRFITAFPEEVLHVSVPKNVFFDIDTPEEYRFAQEFFLTQNN